MFARLAELQVVLEGVALPAGKRELIEYARAQNGGEAFVGLLTGIPEREYRSLDEVGEALAPVQPTGKSKVPLPHAESGEQPGGDAYFDPSPEPGAVRAD